MSRRDELRKSQAQMYAMQRAPKAQQEKKMSGKVCGLCKNFSEGAFTGEGRGSCAILKFNSRIDQDPPVYDLESQDGLRVMGFMDAAKCKYWEKMDFVDKDGTECSDPVYRRSLRQYQD